ncbi:argininosuccinate lyase [Saitozyma podzolica]|uniref:Argininosuccinate lyase n=1 Tax=Saitozyma podzolica TaxID=1890683 RepID=A0A427YNE1_9TREE|nr:argininosuccinate lyase [Saitozyma podzolica]
MASETDFTKRKLWGGRFTGSTDPLPMGNSTTSTRSSCWAPPRLRLSEPERWRTAHPIRLFGSTYMHEFNQSLKYDKRMYAADVKGSIAFSKALLKAGILNEHEQQEIARGLKLVEGEWEKGEFKILPDDEDIHTANERRLSEIVGKDIGGKLHTGRSRNDQVATDMRIWLMDETARVEGYLKDLLNVMVSRAEKEVDAVMPGYTHLQRAQPVRWSHLLLSHAQSFLNDLSRLRQLIPRVSVLPLGSAALAGNPYSLDRELLRSELGFMSIGENSMHAVADRDFVVEWMQWASLAMVHMSRMAEDLIIYSSAEFGFVTLSDAYSTGSSIMPQKKNPDSLELLRGKSGRVFGQMAGFMMSLKGVPSTYNKDLQEDKEPLFDCVDTIAAAFRIAEGVVATLTIHPEKMKAACTMDMLATDIADYLVRKGVPFRETHHISGRSVALAEQSGIQISDLTMSQWKELSEHFTDDVMDVFDFENSVEKRNAIGGPARVMVQRQVDVARKRIEGKEINKLPPYTSVTVLRCICSQALVCVRAITSRHTPSPAPDAIDMPEYSTLPDFGFLPELDAYESNLLQQAQLLDAMAALDREIASLRFLLADRAVRIVVSTVRAE